MLTFYISMLETEEQQDKFSYIYQNYVGFMKKKFQACLAIMAKV